MASCTKRREGAVQTAWHSSKCEWRESLIHRGDRGYACCTEGRQHQAGDRLVHDLPRCCGEGDGGMHSSIHVEENICCIVQDPCM